MAEHTRYAVTTQGNRNLALDHNDVTLFTDLTDADTAAANRARTANMPVYVHEVIVRPIRSHRRSTEVHSTDL